jgi:hypothetical protein
MENTWLASTIKSFSDFMGGEGNFWFILIFFTALIIIYGVFVYYFYKFLAKKNIIDLNLNKYNKSEHALAMKAIAFVFYILEYIVILPILTFFWFTVLAMFILILAKTLSVSTILIITAALVASVRVTSYISQNLSRDLAKMVPFTLLGLAIIQPDFFSFSVFLQRVNEIPALISHIPYYLLFIVILELVMRALNLGSRFFKFGEEQELKSEIAKQKQKI